jgi:plasmid stability protein
MTDVLIRGVPEEVLDRLKRRAAAHNRSLQGELRELLIRSAEEAVVDGAALAREVRERIAERRGGPFDTDSTDLIRADRDSR